MKISKKTQYGLRAMVFLAEKKKGEIFSLKEISEKESIPFSFLEKIFLRLEKSGVLKSRKGVKGGYCLSQPASKITVAGVMKALEGKISLVDCSFCRQTRRCRAKNAWKKIQESLNKALRSITLKDLIRQNEK